MTLVPTDLRTPSGPRFRNRRIRRGLRSLREIRDGLDYDFLGYVGAYGHLYVPLWMGSVRSRTFREAGWVVIRLRPSARPRRDRLYVMPKAYRTALERTAKPPYLVFFRESGGSHVGRVRLPVRGKE
jgi:hypothetical protein